MSHFDDLLTDADPGFFVLMGDPCIYTDNQSNTYETRVIIEKNVEQVTAYETTMPARRTVASFLKSAVPAPKRGHSFVVGADTYTVDQLESDDDHVIRVLLQ